MALLELNSKLKGLRGRFELKDERLRPLWPSLLFAAFTSRLIARQSALYDAVKQLHHLLLHGLACNLQQEQLRKNSMLDALFSQRIRNIPQRQSFRHRGTCPPNLLGDILMRIL